MIHFHYSSYHIHIDLPFSSNTTNHTYPSQILKNEFEIITLEETHTSEVVYIVIFTFILILILIWVHDICCPHMISNTYNFIVKTYHFSPIQVCWQIWSELISYLWILMYQNPSWWYQRPNHLIHITSLLNLSFSNQIVYSIMINTILGNFQGSVRCIWQYSSSYIHIYTISLQTASSLSKKPGVISFWDTSRLCKDILGVGNIHPSSKG